MPGHDSTKTPSLRFAALKTKKTNKKARAPAEVAVVTEHPRPADGTSMSIACVIVSW